MVSYISITEFTFSVNDFGEPIKLTNSEAIASLLTRLLLLEPGTIQSHPKMGVGLVSKYRYSMDNHLSDLKDDFTIQIEKYLPQFQGVKVSVSQKEKKCMISATIDGVVYGFFYDTDTNKINSKFTELENL